MEDKQHAQHKSSWKLWGYEKPLILAAWQMVEGEFSGKKYMDNIY